MIASLDEFGHVGPYVLPTHLRHNDSPVFGFGGFVMPAEEVRGFGTWFYRRKCELLDFEIRRSAARARAWCFRGSCSGTTIRRPGDRRGWNIQPSMRPRLKSLQDVGGDADGYADGYALGGFLDRIAREARMACGRLDPAVTEQPADDRQPLAERERPGGQAVPLVPKPE